MAGRRTQSTRIAELEDRLEELEDKLEDAKEEYHRDHGGHDHEGGEG